MSGSIDFVVGGSRRSNSWISAVAYMLPGIALPRALLTGLCQAKSRDGSRPRDSNPLPFWTGVNCPPRSKRIFAGTLAYADDALNTIQSNSRDEETSVCFVGAVLQPKRQHCA